MRLLKLAAAALWLIAGAACYAASGSLTVVVFNYARVPRLILLSAAKEARRAFQSAGVETDWTLCDRNCAVPAGAMQVTVLPRPDKAAPLSPNGLAYTVLCSIAERCATSYVFYDRVLELAASAAPPVEVALGYVMAHEVGHLLGLRHSTVGIMKAGFTPRDMLQAATGWLRFPKDDATRLRAAVSLPAISPAPAAVTESW